MLWLSLAVGKPQPQLLLPKEWPPGLQQAESKEDG